MHDRALDGLAYPPRRVGRKPEAALGLELAHGVHQPEVAFFDQVGHRQAAAEVVLGDAHHQPKVVLDHRLARREVTRLRPGGGVEFFLRAEQGRAPDFTQIGLQRVADIALAGAHLQRERRA